MVPTNDILSFCPTDTGSNLLSQGAYAVDPQLAIGNQPGVARSKLANKALRQATYIAHCVAQFLCNVTGNNVLDDATPANVIATMALAWANPTGLILAFGGTVVPTGYLLCDGSAISRSTYANLFSVIATANGVGDGSTTFNLPDLRGQFLRGVDGGSGNDPDTLTRTAVNGGNAGDLVGSVQPDAFGLHSHRELVNFDSGAQNGVQPKVGSGTTGSNSSINTEATGGNETRPKNVYVYYIIKT